MKWLLAWVITSAAVTVIYAAAAGKRTEGRTMTEGEIQSVVLEYIKARHLNIYRNNTGRRGRVSYGLCPGSSDLIGFTPDGRFFALELKSPGEKPKPEQLEFIGDVKAAGGYAAWADNLDEALGHITYAFQTPECTRRPL